MDRLLSALKVRSGEGRLAVLLIGLMFFVSAGGAIGGNAIDALFFSRFGTQYLPTMYMALGVVAFVTLLGTSALLGRVTRERLYPTARSSPSSRLRSSRVSRGAASVRQFLEAASRRSKSSGGKGTQR